MRSLGSAEDESEALRALEVKNTEPSAAQEKQSGAVRAVTGVFRV